MTKACIDTDILGWAVKGYTTDGDNSKIQKARDLIDYLQQEKVTIYIPSIVVAELLSDVFDEDERERICDYISINFFVIQFDIITARIFAEIRTNKDKDREDLQKYRLENGVLRCKMKNDWNICAMAIANKCDVIFTNNINDFKAFAGDLINIQSLDFIDTVEQKRKEERETQEKLDRLRKEKEDNGQVSLFVSEDEDLNPIHDDYGEEE